MKIFIMLLSLFLLSCNSKMEFNLDRDLVSNIDLLNWNKTDTTKGLVEYIRNSTNKDHKRFVPVVDRVAVFDNDGTLWSEQPLYYPFESLFDFYKEIIVLKLSKGSTKVNSLLDKGIDKVSKEELVFLLKFVQSGTTNEEFEAFVKLWLTTRKHKKMHRLYYKMTFSPMRELLKVLKENKYQIFMVTGGGTQYARVLNKISYNFPEQNIIGSTFSKKVVEEDGQIKVIRTSDNIFLNDKEGKIISIVERIGKVPTIAIGNSDGDFAMLKYTKLNSNYKTYAAVVRHDDESREFLYDRKTHVGRLDKVLDQSNKYNINIISMKKDFKVIFE